jgi:hypothetical protein
LPARPFAVPTRLQNASRALLPRSTKVASPRSPDWPNASTSRAYSTEPVSDTDADQAWREAIDVRRSAFATQSRRKQLLFAIDPRRLRRR